MNVKELKEKLKNIPNDLPVVFSQNDNPDYGNCEDIKITKAFYHSEYGYNTFDYSNKESVKVLIINSIE